MDVQRLELRERLEAYEVLRARAARNVEPGLAHVLAEQALRAAAGGDWPVCDAAMFEITRRLLPVQRELRRRGGWRLDSPPRLGLHRVEEQHVVIEKLVPLLGRCDCDDFTRNSLGLCRHVLMVALSLFPLRMTLQRFRARGGLQWDPIAPLDGGEDWMARLRWCDRRRPPPMFHAETGRLLATHENDPSRRLVLLDGLIELTSREHEPDVFALLEREVSEVSRRMLLTSELFDHELRVQLFPHQREGVRKFLTRGRLLLGDDMGTGKTLQAIAACHALFRQGHVARGLIVVPASLRFQWLREWQSCTDVPARISSGPPKERHAIYASRAPGFHILNYELLLRDGAHIARMRPEMLVLDEAQRIKNPHTKTAAAAKAIAAPFRLALTGTPLENRIEELASIHELIDDRALAPSWRVSAWHLMHVQHGERGEVVGTRNLTSLRARLAPTFIRRVRREVLDQLPQCNRQTVEVPLTPAQLLRHEHTKPKVAQLVAISKRRPLRRAEFLRLMQLFTVQRMICNGLAHLDYEAMWPWLAQAHGGGPPSDGFLDALDSPKLLGFRRMIRRLVFEMGRKVLVFSQWRRMLRLAYWSVSDLLESSGRRAVFFTGGETPKQRTRGVVEFHDDQAAPVMFATDAGGVGLNLQRAAHTCINLELPWNPAVLDQRVGRVHRLGQTQDVDVYDLVARDGIEWRIAGLVQTKRALFTSVLDSTHDEVLFEQAPSVLSHIVELVGDDEAHA